MSFNATPERVTTMEPRVREILSWYGSDNPGTLTNLARLLNQGKLGGTGRLLDQVIAIYQGPALTRPLGGSPLTTNPKNHHYFDKWALRRTP